MGGISSAPIPSVSSVSVGFEGGGGGGGRPRGRIPRVPSYDLGTFGGGSDVRRTTLQGLSFLLLYCVTFLIFVANNK